MSDESGAGVYQDYEASEEERRRRERYDELAEQIKRGWGDVALALYYEGDAVEFYAERPSHQLVQAWPDYFDEPVLKALHHQSLINEVGYELESDDRELRVVDWDETPFPDDPEEWDLL